MEFASIIGFIGSFFLTGSVFLLGGLDPLPCLAFALAAGGATVITIECISMHSPNMEIIPWPSLHREDDTTDLQTPSAPDIGDIEAARPLDSQNSYQTPAPYPVLYPAPAPVPAPYPAPDHMEVFQIKSTAPTI